jgi:hypothetical protein
LNASYIRSNRYSYLILPKQATAWSHLSELLIVVSLDLAHAHPAHMLIDLLHPNIQTLDREVASRIRSSFNQSLGGVQSSTDPSGNSFSMLVGDLFFLICIVGRHGHLA